jgi:cytochrome c peroxidase
MDMDRTNRKMISAILKFGLKEALATFLSVAMFWSYPIAAEPDLSAFVKPALVPSPAFNTPSVEKIILGRALFFETRLSGGNTFSCASCHQPEYGWTDRRRLSLGETGEPRPRRTPSLQDIGWNRLFARDGRIETLEGFVLGPIAHPDEMNQNLDRLPAELAGIPIYQKLFRNAFSNGAISLDNIAQSLSTYVRTLQSTSSPFDRWVGGDPMALSKSAKSGFALFTGKAGCSQCHTGWRFTDQKFHDIGLETNDKGRGKHHSKDILMQYAFKTPSLRNAAIHPPYMHNGTLSSLEKVIDHYQTNFITRPSLSPQVQYLELTAQEKVNLVEFLESLTDDIRHNYIVRSHDKIQTIKRDVKP